MGGQSSLLMDWLAGCVGGDGHDEEIDGCGRADEVCCVVGSRQGLSKCAGRVTSGEGLRGHADPDRLQWRPARHASRNAMVPLCVVMSMYPASIMVLRPAASSRSCAAGTCPMILQCAWRR